MAVEVDPELEAMIREDPGGIVVQVVGADDAEAAAGALERAGPTSTPSTAAGARRPT